MMTSPLRGWWTRRAARTQYEAAESAFADVVDQLAVTGDPAARSRLLEHAAELEHTQAQSYRQWRGSDPIPWEDGRELSESMRWTALLYGLLAQVEATVAGGGELDLTAYGALPVVVAAEPVLTRMAGTPNAIGRAVLLAPLYEAVEPHVGGQAAEAIACLPSPGHVGWDPIQTRRDWYTTLPASPAGIVTALCTAAAARLVGRLRGLPGLYQWIDRAPTEQLAQARAGAAAVVAGRAAGAIAPCPRCRHGLIPAAGDAAGDLGTGGVMRCDRCRGTSLIEAGQ